ncbi:MAG TPA: lipoyl(octanoyl) transferase LipB [Candidatus Binataceae bacterium]|nr:lipoyl(octanoyl) transferase LipB [Candidatus Binataceae bacterium]
MEQVQRNLAVAELGVVDYRRALRLQTALVQARLAGAIGDTLLLLEHPHVYTLGRAADEKFIVAPRSEVPVVRVSRGGQVTYHGPGQLVAYPILKLEGSARDVAKYLRALEAAMIAALARCGIEARARTGLTGVWNGTREIAKIASIGVGIRRWVTYHGLALNVCPDLSYFDSIVPCGIEGCEMTSIARLGRPDISLAQFARILAECFCATFEYGSVQPMEASALWAFVDPPEASGEHRISEDRIQ